MTVREPIPDLAEAVPVEGVRIDAMIPEAGPVQAGAAGGRALSPLFVTTVLLYTTGVLLLFAFPRSASAWLDDFTPNPVIKVLRVGTGALEYTADRIGISSVLDSARRKFLKQIQREG
ncbi:MAG: hypothetical protein QOF14_841 [Hyphomicrobiales bacterium]|nr:hypothetical protein [Hyphomicrobiales bacterium]